MKKYIFMSAAIGLVWPIVGLIGLEVALTAGFLAFIILLDRLLERRKAS